MNDPKSFERQLAKAKRVLKRVGPKWRRRVGVIDVAVGLKLTDGSTSDEVAIHVYVEAKAAETELRTNQLFPKSVGGVLVDVVQVTGRRTRSRQIRSARHVVAGGSSQPNYGTLGMVLRRTNDATNIWFLTCAHIGPSGTPMFLYSESGGGASIGSVPPNTPDRIHRELSPRHDWEAILSTVDPAQVQLGVVGAPKIVGIGDAKIFDTVFRISDSGQTITGRVSGLEVPIKLDGQIQEAMIQVAALPGNPPFSVPGDSGAILLRPKGSNSELIGIMYAEFRDDAGKYVASAACGLNEINDDLEIDIASLTP